MVKNTLNVGQISEGFVLDHIQAGRREGCCEKMSSPSSRNPQCDPL